MLLVQIICATVLGGVLSIMAAYLIMAGFPRRMLSFAVSFSIGLLLATATLHLLPDVLASGMPPQRMFTILLAGILGFFALEKFSIWRHVHASEEENECQSQSQAACNDHTHSHHHHHIGEETMSILVGDAFHNFTDGLLIAAAFLADTSLGWATTLAIIAHEIPQEAGDFAILLAAGWHKKRALIWNTISGFTSILGGIIGYFALASLQNWVPVIIILAAANFLYIAIADLMPRLKHDTSNIFGHGLMIALGIAIIVVSEGH